MTTKPHESETVDTPFLAEIRALAALETSEEFGAPDIAASIAAMARLARMDLTTVYDLEAALHVSRELAMVMVELRQHNLSDAEIRQIGAIVHCLADNALAFRDMAAKLSASVPLRNVA